MLFMLNVFAKKKFLCEEFVHVKCEKHKLISTETYY